MLMEVKEKVIRSEDCIPKEEYKKKDVEEKKRRWMDKRMYGQFNREKSEDIDKEKMWR